MFSIRKSLFCSVNKSIFLLALDVSVRQGFSRSQAIDFIVRAVRVMFNVNVFALTFSRANILYGIWISF